MKVNITVAAQELGISARTLNLWAKKGRIKFTRSAGNWRLFDSDEIEKARAAIKAAHVKGSR